MTKDDVGRVGVADQALAVPAEPSSTVSAASGFDPSRVCLALDRVGAVLNEVDYDCGHFITGDNLKIMDVQILYDLAKGVRP